MLRNDIDEIASAICCLAITFFDAISEDIEVTVFEKFSFRKKNLKKEKKTLIVAIER
ncbi:hypothetical protein HanRHA438_Chr05g0242591 [Helianthus annuus]|nr:hypothetical protein HanRHA438_Chr05g0242591 [Helianthus annuus]